VLYTKETSVVLGSGVKSNSIPPVTYLQRSINSEQLFSIFYNRSLLSVVVIYKFFRIFFSGKMLIKMAKTVKRAKITGLLEFNMRSHDGATLSTSMVIHIKYLYFIDASPTVCV